MEMPSVTAARHFAIKCTCASLSQKDRGRVGGAGLKGVGCNVREREAETVELMSTDPPVGRPAFSY